MCLPYHGWTHKLGRVKVEMIVYIEICDSDLPTLEEFLLYLLCSFEDKYILLPGLGGKRKLLVVRNSGFQFLKG